MDNGAYGCPQMVKDILQTALARQTGQTSHSSDSQGKLPVPTSGAASKLFIKAFPYIYECRYTKN